MQLWVRVTLVQPKVSVYSEFDPFPGVPLVLQHSTDRVSVI